MITDLVSMFMIQRWLQQHAPQFVDDWSKELPPEIPFPIQMAMKDLEASTPQMGATFLSQTCIARHAIQRWNLPAPAILGAGRPHMFSPLPDQVKWYTDQVPDVLTAAEAQGYATAQVDLGNLDDIQKLAGAQSAIATGLLHFFPDEIIGGLFDALAGVGVTHFAFNHADPAAGEEHFSASAGHVQLHPRTAEDVKALTPDSWQLHETMPQATFIHDFPDIGDQLADQPHRANVFLAVCD